MRKIGFNPSEDRAMENRVENTCGHILSCSLEEHGSVEIYRTLAALHGDLADPCRKYAGKVTVSVPLTGRVYRSGHETVVRGPGCAAFDLPLLRGRDALHLVFPLSTLSHAARIHRDSHFRCFLPGPRICDDAFALGLALALATLLDTVSPAPTLIDSLLRAFAAHIALEYGSYTRSTTPARLDATETAAAQRLLATANGRRSDIGRIATIFRLSLGGFERAYKRATGLTPYAWVMSRREAARERAACAEALGGGEQDNMSCPQASNVFASLQIGAQIRMRTTPASSKLQADEKPDLQ